MSRLMLTAQTLEPKSSSLLKDQRPMVGKIAYTKPTVNINVKIVFCSLLVRNFHRSGMGFDVLSVGKKK